MPINLKNNFFNEPVKSAVLVGLTLVVMTFSTSSSASTGLLDYADAMASIYKVDNEKSTSLSNIAELNKAGLASADCQNKKQKEVDEAAAWMQNKLPPDPTTAIANGSCFIDVMDIKIPTTGNEFLDSVTSSLSPFLKSSICNKSTSWWNDTKGKVLDGQFSNLSGQFSTVLAEAQNGLSAPAQGSGVDAYANAVANGIKAVNGNNKQDNGNNVNSGISGIGGDFIQALPGFLPASFNEKMKALRNLF